MNLWSWLTGRDSREADVYANFERVDELVTNLKKINSESVVQANDAVKAAVSELNNVKGMAEYVGQISVDCFEPTFEKIALAIEQLGTTIEQKANNIKEYEESSWLEKIGSTFVMGGTKILEGVASVVEDLGDGVVSLVGWVAPKDSGVEKWCSDFVQKEWSHDMFNFYYQSDFAKASIITEDSAIAGGCKIAGKVFAYMYGGGFISGAGSAGAGAISTAASNGGRIAGLAARGLNAMRGVASASTWGATALATVAGMGSGTENALLNGAETFNQAAWAGAQQGAKEGLIAFTGGKLGERARWANAGRNGRWSQFEGYDDAISQAGRNAGRQAMENVIHDGLIRGTMLNAGAVLDSGRQVATNMMNGGRTAIRRVGNTIANPITSIQNGARTVGTAVRNIPTVIQAAPGAIATAARTTATFVAANPGVVAQGINAVITNGQASENIGYDVAATIDVSGPTGADIDDAYTDASPVAIAPEEQYRIVDGGNQNKPPVGQDQKPPGGGGQQQDPPGGGDQQQDPPGDVGGTQPPAETPVQPPEQTPPTGTGDPTNPDNGYTGPTDETGNDTHTGSGYGNDEFSGKPFEIDDGFEIEDEDTLNDFENVIDSDNKFPEQDKPVEKKSDGVSAVIPIAAGLSAAAAAGIGAKIFMDKKNNSENGEEDDFETDDWSEEGQLEIDYDDNAGSIADQYLNDEDDYGYHASSEEKYGARSNEELAELQ